LIGHPPHCDGEKKRRKNGTEYWTEVIDKLIAAGNRVAVIGKDVNADQGLVRINPKGTFYDTRNLLSIHGLIALISRAKILITNDSAPVHLAGAFDNWIIVIPTCKAPDHILPIRKGMRYYKALAPYKRAMWTEFKSVPTETVNKTIDKIPDGCIIEDYLPAVSDILNLVHDIK